ncbi:MAG: dienelactone hydrolase family protein [Gemmataceae bacterium]|nr:dienelactone hydrolase family protein [Gemmataceae bacterium]
MRRVLAVWAAVLIAPQPATADDGVSPDVARYELGRRLKAFEAEWEKVADPAARKRAGAELEKVHPQFLSLQFAEAARTLDRATHALGSDKPLTADEEWAASLIAVPGARLIDAGDKELAVTVRHLYPPKGDPPSRFDITLGVAPAPAVGVKWGRAPVTVRVPLPPADDRTPDQVLALTVSIGGRTRRSAVGVSRVPQLAERVKALKAKTAGPAELQVPITATARDWAAVFAELADGAAPETDLPAGGLLVELESVLARRPCRRPDPDGYYRLSAPLGGRKTAPVRLYVPPRLDPDALVPVVVGLHGAGGSENLFFEGYGAGLAVKECEKRGWVFVAPRGGLDFLGAPPVPDILRGLPAVPFDPKRVFLVGHSMGAAQAVRLAQQHPGRFAAVAALGGGGRVTDPKAFADLPVFVAAGERDFGLGMARALNKSLTAGGAKNLAYKEYPGVEHLLIVREALPDVFALFDRAAKRP